MWPVATILDGTRRYWIGSRFEGEGLGWLEDTGDRGLRLIYLTVQKYFTILTANNNWC